MTDRPQKITFAEMRDMGVRGILVYCADCHDCHQRDRSPRALLLMIALAARCLCGSQDSETSPAGLSSARRPLLYRRADFKPAHRRFLKAAPHLPPILPESFQRLPVFQTNVAMHYQFHRFGAWA